MGHHRHHHLLFVRRVPDCKPINATIRVRCERSSQSLRPVSPRAPRARSAVYPPSKFIYLVLKCPLCVSESRWVSKASIHLCRASWVRNVPERSKPNSASRRTGTQLQLGRHGLSSLVNEAGGPWTNALVRCLLKFTYVRAPLTDGLGV